MEIKKGKKLRRIFIEYIFILGFFIIALLVLNFYLFVVVSFKGVYPANYSERKIQENIDKLKSVDKVTEDLLTPMTSFGVYSDNGNYLYGNLLEKDKELIWDNYKNGIRMVKKMNFISEIQREEGILLIKYPLTMQYKNEKLRAVLPNVELSLIILLLIELVILIILWANKLAKKISKELNSLLHVTSKIEEQNLDFNIELSNINEINRVLLGIDKMKSSLKTSLEKQWLIEERKQEQIAALAHDIKTPLTIVKGNVGLLKETETTKEQKDYCNYIENSSRQIEGYIEELLSITKEDVDSNTTDETTSIREIIDYLKSQGRALALPKNINIDWKIEIGEGLYIQANKNDLERGIINIIRNAIDFSPRNSRITISCTTDNSSLIIQVIDQGKGFSQRMLKHGKEQFLIGDESRTRKGHHGLGLFISNNIIKKYNGELILSNGVEGGGFVTIKIPV